MEKQDNKDHPTVAGSDRRRAMEGGGGYSPAAAGEGATFSTKWPSNADGLRVLRMDEALGVGLGEWVLVTPGFGKRGKAHT